MVVGQPLSVKKVFHLLGVNDTTGVYEFATVKSGPSYNPTPNVDNTSLVNTNPQFYGGFDNKIQYKAFTLDFFFQFVKQTGTNYLFSEGNIPGQQSNQPVYVLNRWQKPGDVKPYEQFSQSYSGAPYNALQYLNQSDGAYSDASFIRLKNVSLSYSLPLSPGLRKNVRVIRIYFQGQNLLTITKYQGNDPESQNYFGLPPLRVFTGGFQVTF